MRVYVTGATGGVGGVLIKVLSDNGREVVTTLADVTDNAGIDDALRASDPDVIVHLAAVVGTADCESVPAQAIKTNVVGTCNVAQAARRLDVPLIYVSSIAVSPAGFVYTPDSPVRPRSVYGMTKSWAEEIVRKYAPKHVVVRSTFLLGGGHSPLDALVRSHFDGRPVNIMTKLDTPRDMLPTRAFCGILRSLIDSLDVCLGQTYVAGYGETITHGELIWMIEKCAIEPRYNLYPEYDTIGSIVVDPSKLQVDTGYKIEQTYEQCVIETVKRIRDAHSV